MGRLLYSMGGISLDGFVEGPDGDFGWGAPDEELHQFHNDRVRSQAAQLLGRKLYETMVYWETAHEDPDASPIVLDFAAIWQALPKVVFSSTLTSVVGENTRLATGSVADEVQALKESIDGDIGLGGPGLAAECAKLDLIDEYVVFVNPVLVGGGKPAFGPLDEQHDLELLETRTLGSRVVYMRYGRVR
jgi:dihydrofolate reductase